MPMDSLVLRSQCAETACGIRASRAMARWLGCLKSSGDVNAPIAGTLVGFRQCQCAAKAAMADHTKRWSAPRCKDSLVSAPSNRLKPMLPVTNWYLILHGPQLHASRGAVPG